MIIQTNNENVYKFYNKIIYGGIAGVVSRTLTAPLELSKIRNQNSHVANTSLFKMASDEGFKALWKGNMANCVRIFPQNGINFALQDKVKTQLQTSSVFQFNVVQASVLSATLSGMVSMATIYPFENARTRLSLQKNNEVYKNLVDVFKKTPITHLYQGLRTSLMGFTPYNAIMFGTNTFLNCVLDDYRTNLSNVNLKSILSVVLGVSHPMVANDIFLKHINLRRKMNLYDTYIEPYRKLIVGGLSGCIAVSITYPTDLIRRRQQIQGLYSPTKTTNNAVKKGLLFIAKDIIKTDGVKGLYRGLGACYLKIFPSMAITFYTYDLLKWYFSPDDVWNK